MKVRLGPPPGPPHSCPRGSPQTQVFGRSAGAYRPPHLRCLQRAQLAALILLRAPQREAWDIQGQAREISADSGGLGPQSTAATHLGTPHSCPTPGQALFLPHTWACPIIATHLGMTALSEISWVFISMPYTFVSLDRLRTQRETKMFIILNSPPEPTLLGSRCNTPFPEVLSVLALRTPGVLGSASPSPSAVPPRQDRLSRHSAFCLQCVSQAHTFLFHALVSGHSVPGQWEESIAFQNPNKKMEVVDPCACS